MIATADLSASPVPLQRHVPLAPLTTYKVGGPAEWFAEPGTEDDLRALLEAAAAAGVPHVVLGRGSNVVVSDEGFAGLVIHLAGDFTRITVDEDGSVAAGAAATLPRVARAAVEAGRAGLEFLVGIPGSVGGAVRMNAGCFGSDTAAWLVSARVLGEDAAVREAGPADLDMGYRHTNLTDTDVVLSAQFRTVPGAVAEGKQKLLDITRWRRTHQPGGTLNAGSVFKNPEGDTAGRIIDSLGLKGLRIGDVSVSPRHANFFEAGSGADARSVHALVSEVRRRVLAATGVDLEPEVRFVGRFGDSPRGER